jgi:hypothetical protein
MLASQEIGIGAVAAASDAAAQLVELGQAECVGAVDQDRVDAGQVEAALDDGGAEQHVVLTAHEGDHLLLELPLGHLTVRHENPYLGDQSRQQLRQASDRADPVVHEVDLPPTSHLAQDRLANQRLVEAAHLRAHGDAVGRRRLDGREVAEAREGQLERARDRGRSERQDVHGLLDLFDALLVGDPEAVLLVDDEQAQVGELHVLAQQCRETGERLDGHGEPLETLTERLGVLLAENRRGNQDGDLLAAHHDLMGGARGHLGLAVTDVAADEAVHRARAHEIGKHVLDGSPLIGCRLVGEGGFELLEGAVAAREREPGLELPLGMHGEQLLGHVANAAAYAGARLLPSDAAELVDLGRRPVAADVALYQVQAMRGDEEAVAAGVLDAQHLLVRAADLEDHQAAVDADAVLGMDQQVSGCDLGERIECCGGAEARRLPLRLARAEQLLVRHDREPFVAHHEAGREVELAHRDLPRGAPFREGRRVSIQLDLDLVLREQRGDALGARQ